MRKPTREHVRDVAWWTFVILFVAGAMYLAWRAGP